MTDRDKPRIVYMGTPEFAVPPLSTLVEHGHDVIAVVTQPDRPKGRGRRQAFSPVKKKAIEYGLDLLQPERASDPAFCEHIRELAPDIIVVIAFGQILINALLAIPRLGPVNIHPSLLPKYRGPAPIQWALLNDDKITGLTAIRMDVKLDSGPILLQREVPILEDETAGELHDRLSLLSGEFLLETIQRLVSGDLHVIPQDDTRASYAPKIDPSATFVDWNRPVQKVSAFIRALDPWPGAKTCMKGETVKLFASRVLQSDNQSHVPGRVAGFDNDALYVETSDGVIAVRALQRAGKKRLRASDFLRGFPIEKGAILE